MEGSLSRSISADAAADYWERFRKGEIVPCPRNDGSSLALAVEGTGKLYRLTCTHCGTSSRWFEVTANGKLVAHGEGWDDE